MGILEKELHRLMDGGLSSGDASWAAIQWADSEGLLKEYALPFVEREAANYKRSKDRAIENAAFRNIQEAFNDVPDGDTDDVDWADTPTTATSTDEILTPPKVLRWDRLAKTTFKLGDGTEVDWENATVDQHLARAVYQEALAGACTLDANRHRRVAAKIVEHGAISLKGVPREEWPELVDPT